jgi:plasmid stability protein
MATIQVRDIPDDVYGELRRNAKAAGQSLQAYMREYVVQETRRRMRREAILGEWARELDAHADQIEPFDAARAVREAREERDRELDERMRQLDERFGR